MLHPAATAYFQHRTHLVAWKRVRQRVRKLFSSPWLSGQYWWAFCFRFSKSFVIMTMTLTCITKYISWTHSSCHLLLYNHMPEVVKTDWFWSLGSDEGLAAAGEDNPAGVDVVGYILGLEDL